MILPASAGQSFRFEFTSEPYQEIDGGHLLWASYTILRDTTLALPQYDRTSEKAPGSVIRR